MHRSKKAVGAGLKPPEEGALNAQMLSYCPPMAGISGVAGVKDAGAFARFFHGLGRLYEGLMRDLSSSRTSSTVDSFAVSPTNEAAIAEPTTADPSPIELSAVPCVYSRFRGKMLRHKHNGWIRVENDGVTFTCPTKVGDTVVPKKYTITNQSQIDFIDKILATFEEGSWYKPDMDKSRWKNLYFNRGDAKQFLLDGHIVSRAKGQKNVKRGSIRLEVATA